MPKYLVNIKNKKIFNGPIPRYEVLKPIVLYEKEAGTTANFTLKEDISNFKYLEFFYKTNDGNLSSRKVYNNFASSNTIDLSSNHSITNSILYIKTVVIKITNTSVKITGYNELGLNASGIMFINTNNIYITKVFGYK